MRRVVGWRQEGVKGHTLPVELPWHAPWGLSPAHKSGHDGWVRDCLMTDLVREIRQHWLV